VDSFVWGDGTEDGVFSFDAGEEESWEVSEVGFFDGFADDWGVCFYAKGGVVSLVVCLGVVDGGDAVWEEFSSEDEDVEEADDGDGEADFGDGEHAELELFTGGAQEVFVVEEFGDDDIGGGADECADAAEDGGEGEGHVEFGWGEGASAGDGCQCWEEHGDDGGVVDKRAHECDGEGEFHLRGSFGFWFA